VTRLLRPLAKGATYRALLYHLVGVALGSVALAVLIVGWVLTLVLAITPLVVPVLIGFRYAVGSLARLQAAAARGLIGASATATLGPPYDSFWGSWRRVLGDRAFWNQQAHLLVAWLIGCVVVIGIETGGEMLAAPLRYHWGDDVNGIDVDSLGTAFLFVPAGFVALLVVAHLLGPVTRLSRHLASRLLTGDATRPVRSAAERRAGRHRALQIHTAAVAAVDLAVVVIWALTTAGYFWPIWVILPLGLSLAVHGWIYVVLEQPEIRRRTRGSQALAIELGAAAAVGLFLIGIWVAAGGGYFWPVWPIAGLGVASLVYAGVVFAHHQHRIGVLETSRAEVVDEQEVELRRIERDLHDGAQARLIAVGMSLGLAEQQLEADPDRARELLAEARRGATEALQELRDLARGIHPPILTDRGLEAAIAALAARSPVPVTLSVDVPERPPGAVEIAAYFVVAETLANAIKHAHATQLDITIRRHDDAVEIDVRDDGAGGADPAGAGITGLRRRVEAFDGSLVVTSPTGGPTVVHAELPCGS
jgi:signal transduction histidine kinase